MVTVVKTITEHTNGRRFNRETGKWERRVGTREVPNSVVPGAKRRRPRMEVVWEECPAPRTFAYGSEEHYASDIRGGTVKWEIDGVEGGSYDLNAEEALVLFRWYVREFEHFIWTASGGSTIGGSHREEDENPATAGRKAMEIARRVLHLYGVDLYDTNAGAPYLGRKS